MAKYIIRLDDASPEMNRSGWNRMERLLDEYNVKPLVGVIPDNKDPSFTWDTDPNFWSSTIQRWKDKNWSLAQHGCHHVIHKSKLGIYSEFAGKSYNEQKELLLNGFKILSEHNVNPDCFFAPCHTYDKNTYLALKELDLFKYISDGYAFDLFLENGLKFLPNLFDTPHKILPFGIYTFVFHPNYTTDKEFDYLESFLKKNSNNFISADAYVKTMQRDRKKNIADILIEKSIKFIKKIK